VETVHFSLSFRLYVRCDVGGEILKIECLLLEGPSTSVGMTVG